MRAPALLSALLVAGCHETLVLGSECPDERGECPQPQLVPSDSLDAGHEMDSEQHRQDAFANGADTSMDAELHDGGPDSALLPDAAADTSVDGSRGDAGLDVVFLNGSFELVPGRAGGSLALSEQSSPIAPWVACNGGMEVSSDRGGVGPTDGDTFFVQTALAPGTNIFGLQQALSQPLVAGETYSFKVDLYAPGGFINITNPRLTVAAALSAGPVTCVIPSLQVLALSPEVPADKWISPCIRFTPATNVNLIALYTSELTLGSTLYIDNIRSCSAQ